MYVCMHVCMQTCVYVRLFIYLCTRVADVRIDRSMKYVHFCVHLQSTSTVLKQGPPRLCGLRCLRVSGRAGRASGRLSGALEALLVQ